MLDIDRGKIFRLNGIGALIFQRLTERQTTIQIITEIGQTYGIPLEVVEADVIEFLDLLEKQGLVQRSEEVTPSCAT